MTTHPLHVWIDVADNDEDYLATMYFQGFRLDIWESDEDKFMCGTCGLTDDKYLSLSSSSTSAGKAEALDTLLNVLRKACAEVERAKEKQAGQ